MASAMRYDQQSVPHSETWLALDESQRIELVSVYHYRLGVKLPNAKLHAAIHVIVENQLDQEVILAKDALTRFRAEGLDRHEAIHAIG